MCILYSIMTYINVKKNIILKKGNKKKSSITFSKWRIPRLLFTCMGHLKNRLISAYCCEFKFIIMFIWERDVHHFIRFNSGLLVVPRIVKSTKWGRIFSYLAPKLWNSLPDNVRGSDTLSVFKYFSLSLSLSYGIKSIKYKLHSIACFILAETFPSYHWY